MAAALSGLGHDDLFSDPGFELIHVGDDAHQSLAAFGEILHGVHGLVQGVLIQGAKALVHKHGVEADAAGVGLDLVREADCQGEGGHEGFPSGEGFDAAGRSVEVVDHFEVKTGLAPTVSAHGIAALQVILVGGHDAKPFVGPPDYAVKKGHLDIGLQFYFGSESAAAGGGIGKLLDFPEILLRFEDLPAVIQEPAAGIFVDLKPAGDDRSQFFVFLEFFLCFIKFDFVFFSIVDGRACYLSLEGFVLCFELSDGFFRCLKIFLGLTDGLQDFLIFCLQILDLGLRLFPVGKAQFFLQVIDVLPEAFLLLYRLPDFDVQTLDRLCQSIDTFSEAYIVFGEEFFSFRHVLKGFDLYFTGTLVCGDLLFFAVHAPADGAFEVLRFCRPCRADYRGMDIGNQVYINSAIFILESDYKLKWFQLDECSSEISKHHHANYKEFQEKWYTNTSVIKVKQKRKT